MLEYIYTFLGLRSWQKSLHMNAAYTAGALQFDLGFLLESESAKSKCAGIGIISATYISFLYISWIGIKEFWLESEAESENFENAGLGIGTGIKTYPESCITDLDL